MKQYITFFRMSMMKGFSYRIAAIAGMATQLCFGFLFIMIFEAFYRSSSLVQPISIEELIQIVWLQQSFLLFFALWIRDSELFQMITSGNIAYELCRPTSLYSYWYARLLGQRLSGALLRFVPMIIIAFLLPDPYSLKFPINMTTFVLFLITLILGLILMITLSMLLYISVFYTLSPMGSFLMFAVLGEFLSGHTLPIPLMPDWLKNLTYCLPFRYTSDLPFRIYVGHISFNESLISILIQVFWIIFLLSFGRWWMKSALKNIVVQGG